MAACRMWTILVITALVGTGCGGRPTAVWRQVGSSVQQVDTTRVLYRDGVYLTDFTGVMIHRAPRTDPAGPPRWGLRTEGGEEVYFHENGKLQSLEAVLRRFRPDQVVSLRVSGPVSQYRDTNFITLDRVFVKAEREIEVR